jgi:hypothetical protein
MEGTHATRDLRIGGCTLILAQKWVLLYYMIFSDFSVSFERFWPFLEDLEPFFRPDLGGKLGFCFQLQYYIIQRFLEALREFIRG